ncbi:MAG: phosphoglucosamine mutase [Chloroflexi bacterium]|nr:phosphoglucosamine mutase [Chloroflexota bacterium]
MEKLFGTDGIRGIANQFPLTPEFVVHIGGAIGEALKHDHADARPVALIGRDTRLSGTMIESALAAGLMSQGFDTLHVGVITTPGIAYLTRVLRARCGISISASHNPFDYNGIKVFGSDGFKVPDEAEAQIEASAYARRDDESRSVIGSMGQRRDDPSVINNYIDFLHDAVNRQPILRGKRIVIDCNNGATYDLALRVFSQLSANVITLNIQPDGVNINHGYDSLEPKMLRDTVLREHADFGVQFDGDGDRAVFVDELGNYVDGDFVLAILARDLQASGKLNGNTVVSTVMANIGLEKSLNDIDAKMERTVVGDRWVTERMRVIDSIIGGEQSGHIVLFDQKHTTGDGIYTAIRVADVMHRSGKILSALAACMTRYPQVLVNVRVPRKPPFEQFPQIETQIKQSQDALGDSARILLRYSGTENLARVMIEGKDAAAIARQANAIAAVIQETIQ